MKHWIFDFDGTLANTCGLFSRVLGDALAPYGLVVDQNFIEQIRHKHPERIFEDHLSAEQIKAVMPKLEEAGRAAAQTVQLFPLIGDILETLSRRGCRLSIWTGRDRASTEIILKQNRVNHFFERIIGGSCVPVNKPGHDGLIELIEHHQAESHEMVMVGDHHHDIEPANSLGLISVHAQWKKTPVTLPEKVKPNFQFGSTLDFHQWILNSLTD